MNIRAKLIVITAVAVLGLASVVGIVVISNGVIAEYRNLQLQGYEALVDLRSINSLLKDYLITEHLATPYKSFRSTIEKTDTTIQNFLHSKMLTGVIVSEEAKKARKTILTAWEAESKKCQNIHEILNTHFDDLHDQRGLIYQLFGEKGSEIFPIFTEVKSAITQLNEVVLSSFNVLFSEIEQMINDRERVINRIFIIIATVIALFVLFFTIMISRTMAKTVSNIEKGMQNIAAQDLTQKLHITSKDELGRVAEYINETIDKLKDVILGIKAAAADSQEKSEETTAEIRTMSENLNAISEHVSTIRKEFEELHRNIDGSSTSIGEITNKIESLSQQMETQAASVDETSSSIEEISRSIQNVSEITKGQNEVSEKIKADISEGRKRTQETNDLIQIILDNVEDIQQIVQIINNVAAQTNLLAMNAAIEAAHSGEHGRGFSVVAEEIRKLAESSSSNSKKIQNLINTITQNITDASRSSDEDTETFGMIDKRIKNFHQSFQEITDALDQMATGSGQVQETTSRLSEITREIQDGYAEMQEDTKNIKGSLNNIQKISTVALEGISTIDNNTQTIVESEKKITFHQENTEENITSLHRKIESFKTDHV